MAEIILGLMGGLGLFLYGMRLMSDSLEKAAGAKMRSILEFFTKTPLRGILVGTFFHRNYPVLKCSHGYGSELRQLGAYEPVSGCGRDYGSQHRYDHYLPADRL